MSLTNEDRHYSIFCDCLEHVDCHHLLVRLESYVLLHVPFLRRVSTEVFAFKMRYRFLRFWDESAEKWVLTTAAKPVREFAFAGFPGQRSHPQIPDFP
jgi:hypothetical protein